jgi:hypothetical protein
MSFNYRVMKMGVAQLEKMCSTQTNIILILYIYTGNENGNLFVKNKILGTK